MKENEMNIPWTQEQQDADARFWQEIKYDGEKHESER